MQSQPLAAATSNKIGGIKTIHSLSEREKENMSAEPNVEQKNVTVDAPMQKAR